MKYLSEKGKRARKWSSNNSSSFYLTGVTRLSFSLSSPARCIHDTAEVNANKSTRISSQYVTRMSDGNCLRLLSRRRRRRQCRLTCTLHSLVLPLPFGKVRQARKKIAFAKTGFRDRANSISDLDKTVFDIRRNILIWFTRLRGNTCNRPRDHDHDRGRLCGCKLCYRLHILEAVARNRGFVRIFM